MSKFTEWVFGAGPQSLDLKRQSDPTSTVIRPMVPQLDTSYDSMLRYSRKNELVYACIEKKAQAATDAELVVEKRNREGEWEKVTGHPLVTLLNKPNPFDDGESFIRAWVASENFADYFFCEIVRNGAKQPVGLYPLHPAFITVQYASRGGHNVIDYYRYNVDGYEIRYKPEELMIRRRHPAGSVYASISNLYVALGSVDADNAWTEYVRAFFNNGGMPSVAVVFKGRTLSEDQIKHYQQQWVQKYSRHGTNQRGPAILDGSEVDIQELGSQLDELASETLTEIQESRICMAFGVPPVIIGAFVGLKNVNQRASFDGAMTEFWENTMSPELKSIRNFLTWNMLPYWEPIEKIQAGDIRVNWNLAQVKALQEDVDLIHTRIQEDFKAQLITRDEARAVIKFPPCEDEEVGKEFFKPVAVKGDDEEETKPPPKQLNGHGQFKELSERFLNDAPPFQEGLAAIFDQAVSDVLYADTLEKKTFEFDGLTLGREPTALERSINLKGMVEDFESGKEQVARVLLFLRSELIEASADVIDKIKPQQVHTIVLTPPDKAYARVRKVVDVCFLMGQKQVMFDLAYQQTSVGKSVISDFETKKPDDKWQAFLNRIVDRTISRIINEIQTRAINFFVARGLLDRDDKEIIAELRAALEDQSTKTFESMAQETANSAIGAGRDAELNARADEIQLYEYSCVLDSNSCDPCSDADGMQSTNVDDLPEAPNPECLGDARCRCFRIGIYHEESA